MTLKKKIIVRKVPQCSCVDKTLNCHFIHAGLCKSKNDIQRYNDVLIVNKSCPCNKPFCASRMKEDFFCDSCERIIAGTPKVDPRYIATCQKYCRDSEMMATAWCGSTFSGNVFCQGACLAIVNRIGRFCENCCREGTFWRTCLHDFINLAENMPSKCPVDPWE